MHQTCLPSWTKELNVVRDHKCMFLHVPLTHLAHPVPPLTSEAKASLAKTRELALNKPQQLKALSLTHQVNQTHDHNPAVTIMDTSTNAISWQKMPTANPSQAARLKKPCLLACQYLHSRTLTYGLCVSVKGIMTIITSQDNREKGPEPECKGFLLHLEPFSMLRTFWSSSHPIKQVGSLKWGSLLPPHWPCKQLLEPSVFRDDEEDEKEK